MPIYCIIIFSHGGKKQKNKKKDNYQHHRHYRKPPNYVRHMKDRCRRDDLCCQCLQPSTSVHVVTSRRTVKCPVWWRHYNKALILATKSSNFSPMQPLLVTKGATRLLYWYTLPFSAIKSLHVSGTLMTNCIHTMYYAGLKISQTGSFILSNWSMASNVSINCLSMLKMKMPILVHHGSVTATSLWLISECGVI